MASPKPQPFQARDKLGVPALARALPHGPRPRHGGGGRRALRRRPAAIRDAVNLIAVSGLPGDTSSYQHDDLFDIDWDAFEQDDEIVLTNRVAIDDSPRFSAREAAALIASLEYLAALPEYADRPTIASLTAKLSRAPRAASPPSRSPAPRPRRRWARRSS